MARAKPIIAVIDAETDPFVYGRTPKPFAWGFYDGTEYVDFWGEHCTERLLAFLGEYKRTLLIYAHNGGKFDFMFMLESLENPVKIINGRIVAAKLGNHELRDSYAILPIPLAQWSKEEINYGWFECENREKHRDAIRAYLKSDCRNLFAIVSKFVERFKTRLTIGSTAMRELRRFHSFPRTHEHHDETFRPYYFGGRVQTFQTGALSGRWKIYDVNSMYPHVMRNMLHPIGEKYVHIDKPRISSDGSIGKWKDVPYFVRGTFKNKGALPVRTKASLSFDCKEGEFFACSHEVKRGLEYGLLEIVSTSEAWIPVRTISFDQYVDTYMAEKIAAKKNGDKANETFAKLLLNSAYGKFGQNPENYFDFLLVRKDEPWPRGEWELVELHPNGSIWKKPAPTHSYFDVAVAASITSASRSVLLGAIHNSANIAYCDTDSVICESLDNVAFSESELGAWKTEAEGDMLFIAGKKLYSLFDGNKCVKLASKGVRLTGTEIAEIASGAVPEIRHYKDAPNFKFDGSAQFVDRKIRIT